MATPRKVPSGIDQRGDTFRVRINRNGVKRSASFDDLDDAIRWRLEKLVEVEGRVDTRKENNARVAASISLKSVIDRYLKEVSPNKKGHEKEISRLKMWMSQPWADLPISSIRREHVREWRDMKTASGRAPSTVRNGINLLSAVFRHAKSEWDIDIENPVSGLKRPPQRRGRRAPPNSELERVMVQAAEAGGSPWLAIWITVAAWTALRAGEIRKLQWRDVDFDGNFIHLDDTKNGDDRDVVMLDPAREALLKWRGDKDSRSTDWVFPSFVNPARPMGSNTSTITFARLVNRLAGEDQAIGRVTLHDLRHWACTRLAPFHRDPLHLSKTTGHRDFKVLAAYYNPDAAGNAAAIRARHEAGG